MKVRNLLPIGSIVLLKDSKKRLMIYGMFQHEVENDTIYDYIGVPYPEGFVDVTKSFLFNEDIIEDVLYIGYIDSEFQIFKNQLEEIFGQNEIDFSKVSNL